jgi:hypothetical protein
MKTAAQKLENASSDCSMVSLLTMFKDAEVGDQEAMDLVQKHHARVESGIALRSRTDYVFNLIAAEEGMEEEDIDIRWEEEVEGDE